MVIIDLFAGAGGLSEGFRRVGFNVVSHVEMDSEASKSLKTREAYYYCKEKNKEKIYLDYLNNRITTQEFYETIPERVLSKVINEEISKDSIKGIFTKIDNLLNGKSVNGIIGGPPCQAYSIAGRSRKKDEMKDDPRNYLYLHYLKFLEKYNPDFFVFENVQGLLSAHKGKIIQDIISGMNKLGYDVGYQLLDSKDFGVVQSRKRIILIGFKKKFKLKYPTFEKRLHTYSIKDLFEDLPAISAGTEAKKYDKKANQCLIDLKIRSKDWNLLTLHKSRKINDVDSKIYKEAVRTKNEKQCNIKYSELPTELIKHNNTKSFLDRFKVVDYSGVSHTMVAHIAKDGHYYIHPDIKQNRSISIREAARIQSFPDDYYFESSQTSALKQIGNAVPPLMAEIIAKEIKKLMISAR